MYSFSDALAQSAKSGNQQKLQVQTVSFLSSQTRDPLNDIQEYFDHFQGGEGGPSQEHGIIGSSQPRDPLIDIQECLTIFKGGPPQEHGIVGSSQTRDP